MARIRTERTTSAMVGRNLDRLRRQEGMTIRSLSERLAEAGVSLAPSGITDIEAGRRVVAVDLLTALAAALNVSPVALLTPLPPEDPSGPVELTGTGPVKLEESMLDWLTGIGPYKPHEAGDSFSREHFRRRSLPAWAWNKYRRADT